MTLGQKLKVLLKDNSMTQEDLAERLEVSRQAVGKWVNDKGIPEVGKLVQISNLFGVSMDYLLKEDCEEKGISKEKSVSDSGYYVSQEMVKGYLSYNRQNVQHYGAKELEENTTITLYEDTNIIKMTVAGESIKGFSVPEEFLTFYYEISEEDMNFYHSLVE